MVDEIHIEVVYAQPDRAAIVDLTLAADSTIEQAIIASGLLQRFPDISLSQQKVGIFGQIVGLDKTLTDGDRVEIYRPLQQDPMTARRHRLQK